MLILGQWHNKFHYPQCDSKQGGAPEDKNNNAAFQ